MADDRLAAFDATQSWGDAMKALNAWREKAENTPPEAPDNAVSDFLYSGAPGEGSSPADGPQWRDRGAIIATPTAADERGDRGRGRVMAFQAGRHPDNALILNLLDALATLSIGGIRYTRNGATGNVTDIEIRFPDCATYEHACQTLGAKPDVGEAIGTGARRRQTDVKDGPLLAHMCWPHLPCHGGECR